MLSFTHALQNAHFRRGEDLDDPATYDAACEALDLPSLNTEAIKRATEHDALVAGSFDLASKLGIKSFPTCLVVDDNGQSSGSINGVYDPQEFVTSFNKLRNSQ